MRYRGNSTAVRAPNPNGTDTVTSTSRHHATGVRLDIQALRTLSIVAVVIFHSFPDLLPGGFLGVDVFFVISGFLMYGVLSRMAVSDFRTAGTFWIRRIRRLFPAAVTVIVLTFVAAREILPDTRWVSVAREAIASLFFSVNWVFVSASVDYLQNEDRPSAFQHYWSLSVEEQYYILLPIALIVGAWLARRAGVSFENMGRIVIVGLFVASLAFSVYFTHRDAAEAYFHSGTRLWELALGGIVAAWQSELGSWANRFPVVTRVLGYGSIAASFWILSAQTPIPGVAALLPVVGAGILIAQSTPVRQFRVVEENRGVQFIGDLSYSIYLVHWPVLILAAEASPVFGEPWGIALLLIATVAIAWLMKRFIEDPVRYGTFFAPTRRLAGISAVTALVFAAVAALQIVAIRSEQATAMSNRVSLASIDAAATDDCFGAAAMESLSCTAVPASLDSITPNALIAKDDLPFGYDDNCLMYRPFTDYLECHYGTGEKIVAVVGNSHGIQWLEPIVWAAKKQGFQVVTLFASQCNATDVTLEFGNQGYTDACHKYGEWVQREIAAIGADLVISSQRQSVPVEGYSLADSTAPAIVGYTSYLSRLADIAPVLIVKDPVNPPGSYGLVPDCVAKNFPDLASCEWDQNHEAWQDPQWDAAHALDLPNISFLDLDTYMCRSGRCLPVIGGVLVYRDNTHVTNTFALSLAPQFSEAIAAAIKVGK